MMFSILLLKVLSSLNEFLRFVVEEHVSRLRLVVLVEMLGEGNVL
jgi:hypothetical protein